MLSAQKPMTPLPSAQYARSGAMVLVLSILLLCEGVTRCNLLIGTPSQLWTGKRTNHKKYVIAARSNSYLTLNCTEMSRMRRGRENISASGASDRGRGTCVFRLHQPRHWICSSRLPSRPCYRYGDVSGDHWCSRMVNARLQYNHWMDVVHVLWWLATC